MIRLYVEGHRAITPLTEIIHAVTGESVISVSSVDEADVISSYDGEKIITVMGDKKTVNAVLPSGVRNEKQIVGDAAKLGFYKLAGKSLPWGIITGIRPKKLVEDFKNADRLTEFKERFMVSDKKINLSLMTADVQKDIKSHMDENDICVYIGIPFCPTRCRYCSFVSMPMGKQQKLIEPYVDCLVKEMEIVTNLAENAGKKVKAVYIGGGTPTSLDEPLFEKVVSAACRFFSKDLAEFTVEAGRADTITEEKLKAALDAGMTRVCINPQTMNDEILKSIGRCHTSEEFEKMFNLARRLGIKHINTDLIAGLPDETEEMFEQSFEKLIRLEPDAVTVHTMCVKRAADLKTESFKSYNAEKMVDFATRRLTGEGYFPYYLYRQKDTLCGLENTGFAKKGKESFYNIFMMEDIGTVLGIGAGSTSKIISDGPNRFKRFYNFKNPTEYISGFDEVIGRKKDYGL